MPSFRTKRGRCHLDGEALRIDSSLRGQLRRYREGSRLLFLSYLGLLAVAAGFVLANLLAGDVRTLLLAGGAAAAVVGVARLSNRLRGFGTPDEIPLDAVERVTAVRGRKGLTRPRFVVTYAVDGETRKRYVMMPSLWLSYGEDEFRRATTLFADAGIPVRED
ncbi:hypothetical protein [Haloplanus halophilus]|uniref:hypothetical protein n=1 Tax=Haloplanus halophilus TaxID=2949993 RepID=UPI00203AF20A|nr:hypothetical protein [Haloplanus sp. GDY1]